LVLPAALTTAPDLGSASPGAVAPTVRGEREVIDWDAQLYYGTHPSGSPVIFVPTNAEKFSASATGEFPRIGASYYLGEHPTPETWDYPRQAIWSRRCTQDDQVVRFSRRVYVPGIVPLVHFDLAFVTAPGTRKNPFAWAELLVNGKEVAHLGRDERKLNKFKSVTKANFAFRSDESSRITVVAKKVDTKPAWGYCNGAHGFGVAAEVTAFPETDFKVEETKVDVTGTGADLEFLLANDGSTDAAPFYGNPGVNNSQFVLSTGQGEVGTNVTGVTIQGEEIYDSTPVTCSRTYPGGFDFTCRLPVVHASWYVSFTVRIDWTAAEPCTFEVPLAVSSYHGWDRRPENDGKSWVLKTPGCPT
jgi:hypothetical protein